MTKGIITVLLVLLILLGAVACGSSGIDNGVGNVNQSGFEQPGGSKEKGPLPE